MALPIQSAPVYTLKVPSTNKKIKFRPFLVKEEKALLLAEQSEDIDTMIETLKKVVDDCTFNKIDVEELAVFDLEYILTKLRSKSVGETAELNVPCQKCKDMTLIKLDISNLEVTRFPGHKNKIPLFDEVGVVMKYPKIDILQGLSIGSKESDAIFDATLDCIDYIYDSKSVFHAKEQTREELSTFIENLNGEQFGRIEKFFETMPKLEVEIDFCCPHCGHENKRKLEGIHNFF